MSRRKIADILTTLGRLPSGVKKMSCFADEMREEKFESKIRNDKIQFDVLKLTY
jgi:hypothetical protein